MSVLLCVLNLGLQGAQSHETSHVVGFHQIHRDRVVSENPKIIYSYKK